MVSQFFWGKSKRTQFHLHVTVTLCNIHHRSFFRPYSMSTGAGFSFLFLDFFCFWLLLIATKKDFGTSKKKKKKNLTPPFQNLDSLQATNSLETVGKTQQRGRKQLLNCACSNLVLQSDTGYITMHTSSLRATATPNRNWIHSGIGWFWVSGTIPNKRGFFPNAVDLRVFLARLVLYKQKRLRLLKIQRVLS